MELAKLYAAEHRLGFSSFLNAQEASAAFGVDNHGYRSIIILSNEQGASVVRTFDDPVYLPRERTITTSLKSLLVSPIEVAFWSSQRSAYQLSGGELTNYDGAFTGQGNRFSLTNLGFEFSAYGEKDAYDVAVFVADGRNDFQIDYLEKAIADGGSVLLLIEDQVDCEIADFLKEKFGVAVGQERIYADRSPVTSAFVRSASLISEENAAFPVALLDPISIQLVDEAIPHTVLLESEDGSSVYGVSLDLGAGRRDQELVVIGDADFMTNSSGAILNPSNRINVVFAWDLFHRLSGGEYPVDTSRARSLDRSISIGLQGMRILRAAVTVIVFLILVAAGYMMSTRWRLLS